MIIILAAIRMNVVHLALPNDMVDGDIYVEYITMMYWDMYYIWSLWYHTYF